MAVALDLGGWEKTSQPRRGNSRTGKPLRER
jgi:hypothetical protein